jgi:hypothetical protein
MSSSAASSAGYRPVIVTRAALMGAAVLVGLVVVAALARRDAAVAPALAPLVRARALLFTDRADGAVVVTDAADRHVVSYYADHRLILRDPVTGRQVELEAFGPTNEGVFAGLLK